MAVPLFFLWLKGVSIYKQLQIEEALLRTDKKNWCIVQSGSTPAIVMGISGKRAELINEVQREALGIPIVRRFSGGGTVIVDANTCFVSFILNSDDFTIAPFPEQILKWTETLYRPLFCDAAFKLQAHDYSIGDRKCGGNAQYLCGRRWVHHTSFLWDYSEERMNCLKLPPKMPAYREQRTHRHFLCKIKDEVPDYSSIDGFLQALLIRLQNFSDVIVTHFIETEWDLLIDGAHRKSTQWIATEGSIVQCYS